MIDNMEYYVEIPTCEFPVDLIPTKTQLKRKNKDDEDYVPPKRNKPTKPNKPEDKKDNITPKKDNNKNGNNGNNGNNKNDDSDSDEDLPDDLKFFLNLVNGSLKPITINNVASTKEEICKNPLCNHKTYTEDPTIIEIPQITKINDINDLILLGKLYHCKKNLQYNGLNMRILNNLVQPLTELNDMIGMKNVKTHIVDQILFFLRGYNKNSKCGRCVDCSYNLPCAKNVDDMLHTVITGPPGVGKTQLGKILGKVYKEMGVLSKGHFKLATRSDFVGKYLGHTAAKTQDLLNSMKGGCLFVDEAYSLGSPEQRDSFSKEAIDTINQFLSENRDFLFIIAGYEDALEKCFFAANDGLQRRFTFRYNIEGYNAEELLEIFLSKIKIGNWKTEMDINDNDSKQTIDNKNIIKNKVIEFFKINHANFPNYGGDIETLFLNCKITHSRNINNDIFINNQNDDQDNDNDNENDKNNKNDNDQLYNNRILTFKDIEDGFKMFMESRKNEHSSSIPPIYI